MQPKIEIVSIHFENQPDSDERFDRIVRLILGVEEKKSFIDLPDIVSYDTLSK